jgi:site-specific DNA-cytosine methylase
MNILSLFDGMSCGQLAINRLGIKYDKYYAAEIDKYAIQVTMDNFPNTIQLGDVRNVKASDLPKIDLIMGGSPCQSFSFAGKQKGMATKDEQEVLSLEHYLDLKSQEYEFEGQSYLFWEYMRLLNELKPKYFLLENVVMVEKWERILTRAIGVSPIKINSNLVSAQNRERLYWTNIGLQPSGLFGDLTSTIPQPKDKKILLKDILQDNPKAICYNNLQLIESIPVDEKYYIDLSEGQKDKFNKLNVQTNKSGTLTEAIGRGGSSDEYVSMLKRNAIITHTLEQMVSVRKHEVDIQKLQELLKNHRISASKISEKLGVPKTKVEHWFRKDDSFSIPEASLWLRLKEILGILTDEFDAAIMEFEEREGVYEKSNRVYDENGIAPTLTKATSDEKILVRTEPIDEKYFLSDKMIKGFEKHKDRHDEKGTGFGFKPKTKNDKGNSLRANGALCPTDNMLIDEKYFLSDKMTKNMKVDVESEAKIVGHSGSGGQKGLIYNTNAQIGALCASDYKQPKQVLHKEGEENLVKEIIGGDFRHDEGFRWRQNFKSGTLQTKSGDGSTKSGISLIKELEYNLNTQENRTIRIRRLTPLECERLQTVPDNYTKSASNSQRYKMLGNGWTIDVIAHIFFHLNLNK